ncbi:MAG: UDP-N-acetylglucosamine--N-acetylmuramyl-(pentapeptide) pyrophosphoryl-undecaprenol N-acetylglucosamine transferase [Chloroflexaceae bacterium]|nr:UDP-N-acetylglucosamine--N-acetylmuramyl-(pentapeptide) pyrophosphoryl-undecaprenol N-acetylglucosamine transferase [Chloroflexaceae bacterium]
MRLLLCGGGTGGHVYPALAVAAALDAPLRDAPERAGVEATSLHHTPPEVTYIGGLRGMEQHIVQNESRLPFRALPTAALRGRGVRQSLQGGATMLVGLVEALRLLRQLQPDAILGTGGYVCVPLLLAAWVRRVPTLIYLPDVVPGLAIKFLAHLATQIACNVEDSRRYLPPDQRKPRPLLVAGYPVQSALFTTDRATCRAAFGLDTSDNALPVLLVYGGSLGARSINRAMQRVLPDVLAMAQVIHICGQQGDAEWLRETASQLDAERQARYRLYPYLERVGSPTMIHAFGAADVALCRSGASTLAELPAAGLPAILVPYPYVHQEENADYLVRHGAALKVLDSQMCDENDPAPQGGRLFSAVQRLLTEPLTRQRLAQQSRSLARPDAAHTLADALINLATRRDNRW